MTRLTKLTAIMLAVAIASGTISVLFWHQQTFKETNLPAPEAGARYSQEDMGRLAVITLEATKDKDRRDLSAWVKNENQPRFIELLENAQAGLGWHVHPVGIGEWRTQVQVVLPEGEVETLERLAKDPEGWARTHTPSQTPAEPRFDEMTHVTLQLKTSHYGILVLILGLIIAFFTGAAGIIGLAMVIHDREYRKTPAEATRG